MVGEEFNSYGSVAEYCVRPKVHGQFRQICQLQVIESNSIHYISHKSERLIPLLCRPYIYCENAYFISDIQENLRFFISIFLCMPAKDTPSGKLSFNYEKHSYNAVLEIDNC